MQACDGDDSVALLHQADLQGALREVTTDAQLHARLAMDTVRQRQASVE